MTATASAERCRDADTRAWSVTAARSRFAENAHSDITSRDLGREVGVGAALMKHSDTEERRFGAAADVEM